MISRIALWIVFVLGCGKAKHDKENVNVLRPYWSLNPPGEYELADPSCQESDQRISLDSSSLYLWNGAGLVNEPVQLAEITSDQSLRSPVVSTTRYGRQYSRTCRASENQGDGICMDSSGNRFPYNIDLRELFLRICDVDSSFDRDTYENAAVSAVHYLTKAGQFHREATGDTLKKVEVEVLPTFVTTVLDASTVNGKSVDVRYFMTDNMSYFPSRHLVVVFPQSAQTQKNGGHRYWESQFVLAHEYGHHIEEQMGGFRRVSWNGIAHQYQSMVVGRGLAAALSSISEAFSDLVGFYSLDEDVTSLKDLDGIGADRNLKSPVFGDRRTPKILTADLVSSFLSETSLPAKGEEFRTQDPHLIGAIIAHALRQMFDIALSERSLNPHQAAIEKYRLLLIWRKGFGQTSFNSGQAVFSHLGRSIESSLAFLGRDQRAQICQIAAEVLPVTAVFEGECTRARNIAR